MASRKPWLMLLGSRQALALTIVLAVQAAVFYGFSGKEKTLNPKPLSQMPFEFGSWRMAAEGVMEQEVLDVLGADDVVIRSYADAGSGRIASLFVAYFLSQRTGQAPHSPKNCLPGSGWVPSASEYRQISIPGLEAPIEVNRYVVERGDSKSVVLYWYQTPYRVIASEYEAKFYLVVDSLRHRRSDTALVRVVTPVINDDEQAATEAAEDFVKAFFLPLREYLPS
ncbi:MAG: exosortase C-terminal domain/associated protein EpsI [Bryobacteraceae bacterium]